MEISVTPLDVPAPGACCVQAAEDAGLVYVSGEEAGISRRKSGNGFCYRRPDGATVSDKAALARIRALAIPPAYADVWICPDPQGHIQATGRDAKGRKQYRYHADFRASRDGNKFQRLLDFAELIPAVRSAVERDIALRGLPRAKVLATVVHLLEETLIRIGNEDYAKHNKSYGLTTLRDPHVKIEGGELRFGFKGKSGKEWRLKIHDRRIAKIVKSCQDIPGQKLFQYFDETGARQGISSTDVNEYLRSVTGSDVTAKDFRAWAGTVIAALTLCDIPPADASAGAKKIISAAIQKVAARLGNTPAICRKCYVHPEIIDAYLLGKLVLERPRAGVCRNGLKSEETAVLNFLRKRPAAP